MINIGKEKYDDIVIPDNELLDAIKRGIRKNQRTELKKMIQKLAVTAASIGIIMLTCANIPILYAYASEIPLINIFVQALHVGSGGKAMHNVDVKVISDSKNANIYFECENKTTNNVLSYSISYHSSPVRIGIVFHGIQDVDFQNLKGKIMDIDAVQNVYQTIALEKEDFSFSIVLKKGYNYEAMEFSNPGSLSINFFHDAYYSEGERQPSQTIYYLRSAAVPYGDELETMVEKYQDENPAQVKTGEGKYIIVIGEYNTEYDAQNALNELKEKYNNDLELYSSSGKVSEVPHD